VRSLESGRDGLGRARGAAAALGLDPGPERLFVAYGALLDGMTPQELAARTGYDPWFCDQLAQIAAREQSLSGRRLADLSDLELLAAKQDGFSDAHLARILGTTEHAVRERRHAAGIRPTYARVDTCAAEFQAATPYLYSTYETGPEHLDGGGALYDEAPVTDQPSVIILGSGPNRIGQGVEFDY
jgi:carbamoyl-phosphate synthase large subunit